VIWLYLQAQSTCDSVVIFPVLAAVMSRNARLKRRLKTETSVKLTENEFNCARRVMQRTFGTV
jgi:hypothetical protein